MWEWTTEVGNHGATTTSTQIGDSFAVLRGGSFSNTGTCDALSYRRGGESCSDYKQVHVGFRVVLYIK